MTDSAEVINVFWTGGMDSTFNLIKKLKSTSKFVRPHYIVRHEESTGREIDAMISIRRALVKKFPEIKSRFLPTTYTNEDDIPHYKEIDDEIEELRKSIRVHEQYQIMAYYCKRFDIDKIDVCYELSIDDQLHNGLYLSRLFGKKGPFQSFENPFESLTKMDCYLEAKEKNWHPFLEMTSFCRRPKKKSGKPCGVCGPCIDVAMEGLGFRLPYFARIKAKAQIPIRRYWRKNFLRHDKGLFKMINKNLIGKL